MIIAKGLAALLIAAQTTNPWVKLESDVGEIIQINTASIAHFNNGGAEVIIYIGTTAQYGFDPDRLHRLWFDCRGQYQDITEGFGPTMDAPPRSIAGQIQAIICNKGT